MKPVLIIPVILAALAMAFPAEAQDPVYEFAGVYVLHGGEEKSRPKTAAEDLQLKCFLAFSAMNEKGQGADFYLDREIFAAEARVVYVRIRDYACALDKATAIERCEVKAYAERRITETPITWNYYPRFTIDRQDGISFESRAQLERWLAASKPDMSGLYTLTRCGGLSEQKLGSHLAPVVTSLTNDQIIARMFYRTDPGEADLALARKVRDVLQ